MSEHENSADTTSAPIPFLHALWFWLKLGFISFGGPAGQIAIMHQELVEKKRWISERRFLHALNYCMLLPGPEAQQLATYLGWLMHRTRGGIVAGVLFVLPSLFLLIALSWIYVAYAEHTLMRGVFYGIKPAVTAIVLHAALRIASRSLHHRFLWLISFSAFTTMLFFGVGFPLLIALAALLGFVGSKYWPSLFVGGSHASKDKKESTALIDEHTPLPDHAHFRWPRFIAVITTGLLLWCIPFAFFWTVFGETHPYTQMAWFFTKAALLTFGGAYAVLPYVYQAAVVHYAWLTPAQMMDGLALGETTPGPLIMVVTFVGFVAAYQHVLIHHEPSAFAAVIGALLVTWFTFLPSFIFILAGAPFIESTRKMPRLHAPLVAITAAVVGVIFLLCAFFAYHVFWPQGFQVMPDLKAIGLATAAALLLLVAKRHVMEVIALSAIAGLLLH